LGKEKERDKRGLDEGHLDKYQKKKREGGRGKMIVSENEKGVEGQGKRTEESEKKAGRMHALTLTGFPGMGRDVGSKEGREEEGKRKRKLRRQTRRKSVGSHVPTFESKGEKTKRLGGKKKVKRKLKKKIRINEWNRDANGLSRRNERGKAAALLARKEGKLEWGGKKKKIRKKN